MGAQRQPILLLTAALSIEFAFRPPVNVLRPTPLCRPVTQPNSPIAAMW